MSGSVGLPHVAQEWIEAQLGDGSTICTIEQLVGATSATLHRVTVQKRNGVLETVVIRRFTLAEWLAVEPDLALHEATVLQALTTIDLPTPELIAFDEDGSDCDVPAILMTHLAGSVDLHPSDFDVWLEQMAGSVAKLHQFSADTFPYTYYDYFKRDELTPPTWTSQPKAWQTAIDIICNSPPPTYRPCFLHRDYHPTNILWKDGQLSGIVDWVNACRGHAGQDVGHCRYNLVQLYGQQIADKFLQAYLEQDGAHDYHPYWDLVAVFNAWPDEVDIYAGWPANGVHNLTKPLLMERLDAYLLSILARF